MGQSGTLYREHKKSDICMVIGWQRPWAKDGQRHWEQWAEKWGMLEQAMASPSSRERSVFRAEAVLC